MQEGWTYKKAGVDVEGWEKTARGIKKIASATFQDHPVVESLGGYSGIYKNPGGELLMASCDGVGTKIMIAQEVEEHRTVGIDLVAMSVNDILAQGGKPIFFLDYIATGQLEDNMVKEIIAGVAEGCKRADVALLGGETAEMPGLYEPGVYDLAGFAVGIAQEEELLPAQNIADGDVLLGLPSSGLHSNGYSLVRPLIAQEGLDLSQAPAPLHRALKEELLEPTRIYCQEVKKLRENYSIKGLAHITGGGLTGNIPRVLSDDLDFTIYPDRINPQAIFQFIQEKGQISREEMFKTFNMGVGMVAVLSREEGEVACNLLNDNFYRQQKRKALIIGKVRERRIQAYDR